MVKGNNQKVLELEQKWGEESDSMMEKINNFEKELESVKS